MGLVFWNNAYKVRVIACIKPMTSFTLTTRFCGLTGFADQGFRQMKGKVHLSNPGLAMQQNGMRHAGQIQLRPCLLEPGMKGLLHR
jgi:hypothetical protein